jgi:DNA-binding GntR family transcriptional regulator
MEQDAARPPRADDPSGLGRSSDAPVPGVPAARGEPSSAETPSRCPRLPRRHSVRAQVLAELRGVLASGEFPPGRVCSAPALAERFGVSPTPVREAMQQLAAEGVVETVPNRGFRVIAQSPREAAELAEVRALLEVPPLLRAARVVPPARWEELRPLADDCVEAVSRDDRAEWAEADGAFHRALLGVTGNRQLVLTADEVRRRAQRPTVLAVPVHALAAAATEHLRLLDALCAGDLVAAENTLRSHLSR